MLGYRQAVGGGIGSLTDRQAVVLAMVEAYYGRHGYGPTLRRLAADLGMSAVASAHRHVRTLTRLGRLKYAGRLGYIPTRKPPGDGGGLGWSQEPNPF